MSSVQAVIFNKNKWTSEKARKWLDKHDFKPIKHVDKTLNYLRYRITDPKMYKSFSTISLTKNRRDKGIKLVIGYP